MNFNFGDIVEYIICNYSTGDYTVRGIVTKANPEEFFVKWNDGAVSTEQQDNPANITKVQDNA